MAKLIYSMQPSLDGYIEDEDGKFDWGEPDEEVHAFFNDLVRPVGTHLYGRRIYETMSVWETLDDPSPVMQDFAEVWRAADKVVYSTTLDDVTTARTRLERRFDPEAVKEMKASATSDLLVAGPGLAAHAFAAGLVDEVHLTLSPIILGAGKRCLPEGVRLELELLEECGFSNGMVYLHYAVKR